MLSDRILLSCPRGHLCLASVVQKKQCKMVSDLEAA